MKAQARLGAALFYLDRPARQKAALRAADSRGRLSPHNPVSSQDQLADGGFGGLRLGDEVANCHVVAELGGVGGCEPGTLGRATGRERCG